MPKPMVCDVWTWGDPFVGFVDMHILVPWEGERAKATSEDMRDALFKS
jgi:hypothetical protein